VFLAAMPSVSSADKTILSISPGSRSISDEEMALAPDRSGGPQSGLILVDETDRIDGRSTQIAHHFRAKVFSSEAQDLQRLEIPLERPTGVLKKWWAWTLCPGAPVAELGEADLKQEMVPRPGTRKIGLLTATLRGAGPGCVIDYGYIVEESGFPISALIEIQRSSPSKLFRYRWTPGGPENGTYHLGGTADLHVSTVLDGRAVLVTGKDIPPWAEEPSMPPRSAAIARLSLLYRPSAEAGMEFWRRQAKEIWHQAEYFAQEEAVRQVLDVMHIPTGAPWNEKVKKAYDWLGGSIKNVSLQTSEDVWSHTGKIERAAPRAMGLLEKKAATGSELAFLFLALARTLGADASLILASRTQDHYFDPTLPDPEQADALLVAVREPGGADDALQVIAPGSGLPFGEIPWWFTEERVLMFDSRRAKVVRLAASEPRRSVSDTRARITPQNRGLKASWSRTGTGQQGYEERLLLRRLLAGERRLILNGYCGAGEGVHVSLAEAPDIGDVNKGFRLVCEATQDGEERSPSAEAGFRIDGPWLVQVPRFEAETRVHPIVFPFPRIDNATIEIDAPEGLVPSDPPSPAKLLESAFGHYALFVRPTETGYQVERSFSLAVARATVEEYPALREFLNKVREADGVILKFRPIATP